MLNHYRLSACNTRESLSLLGPNNDKNKCYLQDKMLVYKFFSATKMNHQKLSKAVRVHYKLINPQVKKLWMPTLFWWRWSLMWNKRRIEGCYIGLSKDDDRDKIANKTKIAPKEVKEIPLLTMPLLILIMILALISLRYWGKRNCQAFTTKSWKGTCQILWWKSSIISYHHTNVWFFLLSEICTQTVRNTILFNRREFS